MQLLILHLCKWYAILDLFISLSTHHVWCLILDVRQLKPHQLVFSLQKLMEQPFSLNFKQRYADSVLELERLNKDLNNYLLQVQKYCQEVRYELLWFLSRSQYVILQNNKQVVLLKKKGISAVLLTPESLLSPAIPLSWKCCAWFSIALYYTPYKISQGISKSIVRP